MSHLLTDESYIKELAKTDRKGLQRIYDAIVDFFDKIFKRYSEDASPRETEFKDALKELQGEFNTIKAMYENALKETTNVQQSKMVLPSSGDGADVLNSKEYWKPDLSVSKLEILYKMIDRDAKSSVKYITDTSKWLYTNIDGTKVFAIYSVENISKPTLLYECKGKQATFERERLIDLLEELDDGKDTIGRADIISEILSGNWVQKIGSLAYSARSGGRTRGNSDVRVLPTPSKRKPRGAFISVIKNLFEIEERTYGDVLNSKESTDYTSAENIAPGVQGTQATSDAAYFELKKEVRKKLEEHIKKYGAIKKGEDAVRDAQFPVQTSDDRYVRRFTRTVFEADSVTDEVAAEIVEEVANGSLWTTYSRITDKKSTDAALNRFESLGYEGLLKEWEGTVASSKGNKKERVLFF